MANLYARVHRLKAQGWTWQRFIDELDILYPGSVDEKTLLALYRQPHRRASKHTAALINQLHQKYFPSPFPEDSEALLGLYNRLVQCKRHNSLDEDRRDLLRFLQRDCQHGEPLRRARLHWLKADIHLDQLPRLRDNGLKEKLAQQKQLALAHYAQAHALLVAQRLEQPASGITEFTLYKVEQNMLACYLNALPTQARYSNPDLLDYLRRGRYFEATRQLLKDEPYQWLIARNALRLGAILQDKALCEIFFEALCRANKAFVDPSYQPREAPALADSPVFEWAIKALKR
ncbi:MAG: hypothetical protein ACPG4U_13895 [Pseudomonadales bacterium]